MAKRLSHGDDEGMVIQEFVCEAIPIEPSYRLYRDAKKAAMREKPNSDAKKPPKKRRKRHD